MFNPEEEDILQVAINFVKNKCPKSNISLKNTVWDIAERFYASLDEDEILMVEEELEVRGIRPDRFMRRFETIYATYGDYVESTKMNFQMYADIIRLGSENVERIYATVVAKIGNKYKAHSGDNNYFYISENTGHRELPETLGCFYNKLV